MTIDIGFKDAIAVHLKKNQEIKLTCCGHRLYYFDTANDSPVEIPKYKITDNETIDKSKISVTGYSFVSNVASNKECFTQRKIEGVENT